MTMLTAGGSFAAAYLDQFDAEVASFRELGEAKFIKRLAKAKVVIHNAASIGASDLEASLVRNFDFTRYLVNRLQLANPAAHLIFLSSMSVLDPADDEAYGDALQMTPYAYAKYLAETYCLKSDLSDVSCVRFSTLFYRNPDKDGLSKLIADAVTKGKVTIFNGGQARRNFLPLPVAARYVQTIASRPPAGKLTYTLAAPQSTSFGDVVAILRKQLPDLQIEDRAVPAGPPVLAEFGSAGLRSLERQTFSLEDEIVSYLKSLQS